MDKLINKWESNDLSDNKKGKETVYYLFTNNNEEFSFDDALNGENIIKGTGDPSWKRIKTLDRKPRKVGHKRNFKK